MWKNRFCFKCLLYPTSVHFIKSCQKKGKCSSCISQNHRTAICEKLESPTPQTTETENKPDNGKTDVHLVTSKTSVLLQTATAIASGNKEKCQLPVKVLVDPGSQGT